MRTTLIVAIGLLVLLVSENSFACRGRRRCGKRHWTRTWQQPTTVADVASTQPVVGTDGTINPAIQVTETIPSQVSSTGTPTETTPTTPETPTETTTTQPAVVAAVPPAESTTTGGSTRVHDASAAPDQEEGRQVGAVAQLTGEREELLKLLSGGVAEKKAAAETALKTLEEKLKGLPSSSSSVLADAEKVDKWVQELIFDSTLKSKAEDVEKITESLQKYLVKQSISTNEALTDLVLKARLKQSKELLFKEPLTPEESAVLNNRMDRLGKAYGMSRSAARAFAKEYYTLLDSGESDDVVQQLIAKLVARKMDHAGADLRNKARTEFNEGPQSIIDKDIREHLANAAKWAEKDGDGTGNLQHAAFDREFFKADGSVVTNRKAFWDAVENNGDLSPWAGSLPSFYQTMLTRAEGGDTAAQDIVRKLTPRLTTTADAPNGKKKQELSIVEVPRAPSTASTTPTVTKVDVFNGDDAGEHPEQKIEDPATWQPWNMPGLRAAVSGDALRNASFQIPPVTKPAEPIVAAVPPTTETPATGTPGTQSPDTGGGSGGSATTPASTPAVTSTEPTRETASTSVLTGGSPFVLNPETYQKLIDRTKNLLAEYNFNQIKRMELNAANTDSADTEEDRKLGDRQAEISDELDVLMQIKGIESAVESVRGINSRVLENIMESLAPLFEEK